MEECARMNCDKAAVALLTFAPQQAKAWLFDLDQPDPAGGIILCRKHANATVVPMSWQLVDGRDPAWPGPASAAANATEEAFVEPSAGPALAGQPEAPAAPVESSVGAMASSLPSDSIAHDAEFAALRDALPVVTQPYAEPRVATLRAAGVLTDTVTSAATHSVATHSVEGEPTTEADMSLFQLPLSDAPAVTPHPDYR